jgi:hypothetical protein
MTQTAPLPSGCVPPDVGLRSGWQGGGAQCVCTAAPEALGLDQILNCAATELFCDPPRITKARN